MDPQYVRALRDAKSLLDDGIFSEKESEEQKDILKQRFHVSQPGVSPAAPVHLRYVLRGLCKTPALSSARGKILYY